MFYTGSIYVLNKNIGYLKYNLYQEEESNESKWIQLTETTGWRITKYLNLYPQDFFQKQEAFSLTLKKIDDNYVQDVCTGLIFPIVEIENETGARTFKISDNNERVFVRIEKKLVSFKNIVMNSMNKKEKLELLQKLIEEQEQYRKNVPKQYKKTKKVKNQNWYVIK